MIDNHIVVVGGAGYVGSVLLPKLQQICSNLSVIDNFWFWSDETQFRSECNLKQNIHLIKKDIVDHDIVDLIPSESIIINLACLSNDPMSDWDEELTWDISYNGVINLINSCVDRKVNRFIQISTSNVYGFKQGALVNEEEIEKPVTLYSQIKAEIDHYLKNLIKYRRLNTTILRPATLYGFSPRMRLDTVINFSLKRIIEENSMFVHGGGQIRPFLHIEDLCDVIVKCLDNEQTENEIFNVCNENISINKLAKIIKKCNPKCQIHRQEVEDRRSFQSNNAKLHRILGRHGFYDFKELEEEIPKLQYGIKFGDYNRDNISNLEVLKRIYD